MRKLSIAIAAAVVLSGAGALAVDARRAPDRRTTTVEVAEIASRIVTDPDVVDADGLPTRGNFFVTEGYLYPQGTVTCEHGACNGVVYDAEGQPSPQFPDKVIGRWTCYGTFVEDFASTTTGPLVATTQLFDFDETAGDDQIVTSGYELVDIGVPIERAIVGTTGRSRSGGVQTQTLLGLNNAELVVDGRPLAGVTLEVELETR